MTLGDARMPQSAKSYMVVHTSGNEPRSQHDMIMARFWFYFISGLRLVKQRTWRRVCVRKFPARFHDNIFSPDDLCVIFTRIPLNRMFTYGGIAADFKRMMMRTRPLTRILLCLSIDEDDDRSILYQVLYGLFPFDIMAALHILFLCLGREDFWYLVLFFWHHEVKAGR